MFMRAVDIPAIKFARKMEGYPLQKDDESVLLQTPSSYNELSRVESNLPIGTKRARIV